jgi:hypothetical protein
VPKLSISQSSGSFAGVAGRFSDASGLAQRAKPVNNSRGYGEVVQMQWTPLSLSRGLMLADMRFTNLRVLQR